MRPFGKRTTSGNSRAEGANLESSAALSALAPSATGINRWWTYEEHGIPGVGTAYTNINTGNLLVQVTDFDFPERGIDLALRRTYNSMSQHDANNDDGTTPGLFGNGWTSTFDAHISSPGSATVSVWDIDGARYDFDCSNQALPSNTSPCVNLTAGDHNELYLDPNNHDCTWAWQKKNGTVYEFYQLGAVAGCTQYGGATVPAGLYGALGAIYARNHNNSLTFSYAFVGGDGSNYSSLSQMVVKHSDGDALVLAFGSAPDNSGGATPTELSTVTLYRNGSGVPYERTWYGYNQIGNLLEVDHPANNTGVATALVAGTVLPETYVLYPSVDTPNSPPTYEFACGPRYYMGGGGTGGGSSTDGSCLKFSFGGVNGAVNQLTEWHTIGIANFVPQACSASTSACYNAYNPGDKTGSLLQPGQSTGWQIIDEANFIYGGNNNANNPNAAPCLPTAGSSSTCMADTDGHVTVWDLDGSGRVKAMHASTGAQSGVTWLLTQQFWSAETSGPYANNIVSVIDPRGNETDYAYDANGNTLVVAQPPVTTSSGKFRPTSLYAYDAHNNVVAYCDATKTQGASWPSFSPGGPSPAPATCSDVTPPSGGNGITVYKWNSPSYEPDGELTDTYTPMGYHVSITYDTVSQDGGTTVDYGLPTKVAGAQYSQADGTIRTPTQNFTYDAYGNLATYGAGNGTWTIQYDTENRVVMREDPDQVSSYTCYYHDGSVHFTQTANQHSLDNGGANTNVPNCNDGTTPNAVNYTYDGDGDAVVETHRHGGAYVSGAAPTLGAESATVKYYDGLDRLVEVVEPYDSSADMYTNPWMTRYLYDLTQWAANGGTSATVAFKGVSYAAYGNLFKTEELLASGGSQYANTVITPGSVANDTWTEVKGQGFDALDRMTDKYAVVGGGLNDDSLSYDANELDGSLDGLLAKQCNQAGQCQRFDYDARNMLSVFTSSDGSAPKRTYTYDADGRTTTITSAAFTTAPQTYTYDLDGHELISTEAKGANGQTAGGSTITHHYYPDGKLESVDVGGSVLVQAGLFSYDYRPDGRTKTQVINDGNVASASSNGKTTVSYTYSNAGRLTARSEAGTGSNAGATTNLTWTALGTLQSDQLPQTTLNKYEYSAEGEVLGVSSSAPSAGGNPATWTYDVRGEVTSSPPTPIIGGTVTAYANSEMLYANGTPIEIPLGSKGGAVGNTTNNEWSLVWDDKMGVVKSMRYNTNNPNATPTQRLISTTSSSWKYDAAGRLTSETSTTTPASDLPTTWTLSRDYDAENHETDGGNMLWGPNGHPALISTGTKFQTLHWDGNQLLFTTELRNGSGALVDIKVGSDGDITPLDSTFQGLTFYDRGPGGLVLGCHNKQGTTYVGLTDARAGEFTPTNPVCTTAVTPSTAKFPTIQWSTSPGKDASGPLTTAIAPGTILGMPRPDGYAFGLGTLQGTRTFDSSAGTWTSPDAYGGDIHDPMSQKSYMWNGNNGVGYADPSGYDAIAQGLDGSGGQPLFTDWSMTGMAGYDNPTFGNAMVKVSNVVQQLNDANSTPDPQNGHYVDANGKPDPKGAAHAAQNHFKGVISALGKGMEVGCLIRCTSAGCGYGPGVLGSNNYVDVGLAPGDSLWHAHPPGDNSTDDMDGHNGLARQIVPLVGAPFTVYTSTSDGKGWAQTWYAMPGENDPPVMPFQVW